MVPPSGNQVRRIPDRPHVTGHGDDGGGLDSSISAA